MSNKPVWREVFLYFVQYKHNQQDIMGFFGGFEWLIIILIIIIFFGAKKFPEIARGLGRGIVEFRKASKDDDRERLSEEKKDSAENTDKDKKE